MLPLCFGTVFQCQIGPEVVETLRIFHLHLFLQHFIHLLSHKMVFELNADRSLSVSPVLATFSISAHTDHHITDRESKCSNQRSQVYFFLF